MIAPRRVAELFGKNPSCVEFAALTRSVIRKAYNFRWLYAIGRWATRGFWSDPGSFQSSQSSPVHLTERRVNSSRLEFWRDSVAVAWSVAEN